MPAPPELGGVDLPDLLPPFDVQVDPATGSAGYTFALPLPAGRQGFGPSLALSYRGAANSPYGFGWTLDGPISVTVFDDRAHPRYDGTDRYAFGGAELVPALTQDPGGLTAIEWDTASHHVRRYRSRHEGTYHRVEQWTAHADGDVHWRVRRPDGSIAVFGRRADGSSRIRDPHARDNVYEWLLEGQYDRFGNAIRYEYAVEDAAGADLSRGAELARVTSGTAFTQRLLKRVQYANHDPLTPDDDGSGSFWHLEVVLDYGDHESADAPEPAAGRAWPARPDPYSSYRPGFEVRTFRLCRRFLVFHRFSDLGAAPQLVRSVDLTHDEAPTGSLLTRIAVHGFGQDAGSPRRQSLPGVRFAYSDGVVERRLRSLDDRSLQNLPQGLHGSDYRWADLRGEGLPGILTISAGAWYFKPNLGGGRFGAQERLTSMPSDLTTGAWLSDFDRDGNFNVAVLDGRGAGFSELDRDTGTWQPFTPFECTPVIAGPGRQDWVDVDRDGQPDTVLARGDATLHFPSQGKAGYGAPVELPRNAPAAPALAERAEVGVFLVDLSGDGELDVVQFREGRVEYWPGLGGGRLGAPVDMADPPVLPDGRALDVRRVRFVDLDGTGPADIVYVDDDAVRLWRNAAGNGFVPAGEVTGLPVADDLCSAQVLDLLGDGTQCLVWSSVLSTDASSPIRYLRLMADGPPRRLVSVQSEAGGETVLEYGSSAAHYLRDEQGDEPWLTKLPHHMTVVDRKITIDHVAATRSVTRFSYHSGYFDSAERLFRGFLCVDVHDSGSFHRPGWGSPDVELTGPTAADELPPEELGAPSCRRLWHSPGDEAVAARMRDRFWAGDPDAADVHSGPQEPDDDPESYRMLAGRVVRSELFAVAADGNRHATPIGVQSTGYLVRRLQPAVGDQPEVLTVDRVEDVQATYEEQADDPRIEQHLVLDLDDVGSPSLVLDLGCPRRAAQPAADPSQTVPVAIVTRSRVRHLDEEDGYLLALPIEREMFEARGIGDAGPVSRSDALTAVSGVIAAPLQNHAPFTAGVQLRRTSWERTLYRDAARSAALGLGDVGPEQIVHHERHACFSQQAVTDVYGARVTPVQLADELRYEQGSGYWWAAGPVAALLPATRFSMPIGLADGSTSESWQLDDACLLRSSYTDAAGNTWQITNDYRILAPVAITDPNGTITEARYDAVGVPVLTSTRGTVLDAGGTERPYGTRALSAHTTALPTTSGAVLTDPAAAVAEAGSYHFLDLAAFWDRGRPPCRVDVVREQLVDDGDGNHTPAGPVQVAVRYFDAFGRVVQSKQRVDPGPAVTRGGDGSIITGADGVPVPGFAAQRWRASGHTVFDSLQQAVLQYEPFFTGSPDYEPDPLLQTFGVAERSHYDAAGRLVGADLPNGTRVATTIGAWSRTTSDPNDTVVGSDYELQRQALPADDPQRQALERARAVAGTPTETHVDPMGREVLEVTAGIGQQRRVRRILDDDGNALALVDARGITVEQNVLDMAGRLLRKRSADGGQTLVLLDAFDRDVRRWDSRGFETVTTYDAAHRPVGVRVTGGGLDNLVERMTYGEDVPQAAARNLRGMLAVQHDAAGRHEQLRCSPQGAPLQIAHRLRASYDTEPDWDSAGETLEPTTYTATMAYDALARPTARTSPDGATQRTTYRRDGGVERITVSTDDGLLTDATIVSGTTRNAEGQHETVSLGNGATTVYRYDRETRRLAAARTSVVSGGGERTLSDVEVARDPVGNITRIVDHAQESANGTPLLQGLTVSPVREFRYDPYNQLVEATGRVHQALLSSDASSGGAGQVRGTRHLSLSNGAAIERYTQTFGYDLGGNLTRIRHTGTTRSWTADMWVSSTSNRRTPATDANGVPVTDGDALFDAAGNMIGLPHLAALDWDYRNRLRRATVIDRSGAGEPDDAEHYVYDAAGRRIRKITERLTAAGVERTEKIYLEGCELLRRTRGGATRLQRVVSLIEDDERCYASVYRWTEDVAAEETDDTGSAEIRFLVPDHLGSTVLELGGSGEVISYEEHFAYGGSSFLAGNDLRKARLRDRRYTGKERDDATGLYYYGYRYYAAWIGGWLSCDPAGTTSSLNLYEFVANNPVNLVDPDGLQATRSVLDQVPRTYTRDQAMRHFNNGRGRELGIRALEIRREGNNWIIVRQENYTPRLRQLVEEHGGDVERAGVLYEVEQIFADLDIPPLDPGAGLEPDPDAVPAGEGTAPPVPGTGGGGGTSAETPPTGEQAEGNSGRADGSTDTSTDAGSGSGSTGTGTGSGSTGTGPGGGGTGDTTTGTGGTTGTGTGAGTGTGTGNGAGTGTGAGTAGNGEQGGDDGTGESGGGKGAEPGGEEGGVQGGVENGVEGGQVGGDVHGSDAGSVDGRLDGESPGAEEGTGSSQVPGGTPTGSADGTGDGSATGQGDSSAEDPTQHGTGTDGGTGTPEGRAESSSPEGSPNPGSGGGSGGSANPQEPTTLDRITQAAGYWHLEFGGGEGGTSGGIPGGMGFLSGWGAQVAFLVLTVADIALTIFTLGGFKAVMTGLKAAVTAGIRGLRTVIARGARGIGAMALRLFRSAPGQRTPLLRRLGRFFWEDRRSFGMWRDFRARWGFGAGSGWSMEHMIIKQRWYRGANPLFAPGTRMNRILQGLGDAGWNVVPIPGRINTWLFNNPVKSAIFNYGTYAGGGYGLYRLWDYALDPLSDDTSAAPPPSQPATAAP